MKDVKGVNINIIHKIAGLSIDEINKLYFLIKRI